MLQPPIQLDSSQYDEFKEVIKEKINELFNEHLVERLDEESEELICNLEIPTEKTIELLESKDEVSYIVGQLFSILSQIYGGTISIAMPLDIPHHFDLDLFDWKTRAGISALNEILFSSQQQFASDGAYINIMDIDRRLQSLFFNDENIAVGNRLGFDDNES